MPRYSTPQIEPDGGNPRVARRLLNRPEKLDAINEARRPRDASGTGSR